MDLSQLHERIRLEVLRRISTGTMSVSLLARQTGLGQPHVSNFVRERRKLSLSALDLVLDALRMRVEDLLPRQRETASRRDDKVEKVPVVTSYVAMHDAYIRMSSVLWELTIARKMLGGRGDAMLELSQGVGPVRGGAGERGGSSRYGSGGDGGSGGGAGPAICGV